MPLGRVEISTTDYHTAGEPFRIVTGGGPDVPGDTVRLRREYARSSPGVDFVRRMLCHEPRGHADMYGCFLVPPDDEGAQLGALFWHKDGFSTACGHGTLALGVWAVEAGVVDAEPDGRTEVVIDVPSGRVTAEIVCAGGQVESAVFRNVASYVLARGIEVTTDRGATRVDVSYGGAIYASVRASDLGLSVRRESYQALIAAGREIKGALEAGPYAEHPDDPALSGIYGTILYDDLGATADGRHQRNVTVFADGQVDRSPCGSGTSARLPLLVEDGLLRPGETLTHESVVGSRFAAAAVDPRVEDGRTTVTPEVAGMAYLTGSHTFVLDERDPLGTGFVLR